jgi:hypothetical protein
LAAQLNLASSVADPDSHHFGKLAPDQHYSGKLDQDPDQHHREKLDPDLHQSEKQDSDPHPYQSEKVEALEGHFGAAWVKIWGKSEL